MAIRTTLRSSWRQVMFVVGLWAGLVAAQVLGPIKGFKLADPFPPPHDNQIKSLLEADSAFRLSETEAVLTNAILHTFRENGQPDLIAKADIAFCNTETHSANSPGPLEAGTADGKFTLSGEGFLWLQTNATLIISNRVHTEVKPDLTISSHELIYQADVGLGVYSNRVRLQQGTNWTLTSSTLTFTLPRSERQLQDVTADKNVVIDYPPMHATGEHAVYTAGTGIMRMTGQPLWRAEQREGKGDELVIDRTNKIFQANGHAWLRLPGQTFGTNAFLSPSNSPARKGSAPTNHFIEVSSQSYEIRTNWAAFRGGVRVQERVGKQVRGNMTSSFMLANFTGTNELQNLIAETNVVIAQEDNRFTGGKAVFTSTNQVLEITEKPTWQAGPRFGKGDLISVDQAQNALSVRGNAYLRMPANELGQTLAIGPTNSGKLPNKKPAAQFAEVFCDHYVLRPTNSVFYGGVYASHPQMNWSAETVNVLSAEPALQVIIAESAVTFDLLNEKGQKYHGIGDKAVYTNGVQTLYRNNVRTILTNKIVRLTGALAELTTTNYTVQSSNIVYDLANNKLFTAADYRLRGAAPAQTNLFVPPKLKLK